MIKNIKSKILSLFIVLTFLISGISGLNLTGFGAESASVKPDEITIVFTHDMHSHLEKFPEISTVINSERKTREGVFLLDAGDFSMGTPFHTIYKKEAAELRMMGSLGYDVTTLGNHEFDFRSKGISAMLNSAVASGDKLPELTIANIDWEGTLGDEALKEDGENLKKALENYGYKDRYIVIEKEGAKVAVFGIFGKEAASYAPESGTLFLDPVETAKGVVEEIEANEDVDLVVCISHSGTNPDDPEKSEDEILAQEVEGIDLIVSGHSHSYMIDPIINGKTGTLVASCGQYNESIGIIRFKVGNGEEGKEYKFEEFVAKSLDDVKKDPETLEQVNAFHKLVDDEYFSSYGYTTDQVMAKNDIEFTPINVFGLEQKEDTLGNLISDSYIYGVMQAEGKDYEKIDLAVAPFGIIRASLDKGEITAGDAFNVLSIGTGKDGIAGYPLVSVYLTGTELKLVAEVDATISNMMVPARLYSSGLVYKLNPNRMILNKTYEIELADNFNSETSDFETYEIEDEKLYRVVADLYSAQMLGMVNDMSKGILALVPKDKEGNPIADYEDCIIYTPDGKELKEWYALATYIDSFKGDKVPDKYAKEEGRKVIVDSKSPSAILDDTNKYFWMIIGAAAVVVIMLVLIIRAISKAVKRKKNKI